MNTLITAHTLLFAGECFLGAMFILAVSWLATKDLRRAASQRHLIWLVAFCAVLALPVLAAIVPSYVVIEQSVAAPAPPLVPYAMALPMTAVPAAAPSFDFDMLATVILGAWFAGFCWVALRGVIGLIGLRTLYRRSVPYFLEGVDPAKLTVAGRNWKLRLSTTPGGAGPVTWGFLKPIVMLPKAAVRWQRERLEAVLLHEVAHVRRYDSFTQAISLLACALYWPIPLVWMGARAMRNEAERAADDAVLLAGVKASTYAEALLRLAAEFRPAQLSFCDTKFSMAGQSALEARLKSILAPAQSRSGMTSMNVLKIAGLALLSVSLMAAARPAFAEKESNLPTQLAAVRAVDSPTDKEDLSQKVMSSPGTFTAADEVQETSSDAVPATSNSPLPNPTSPPEETVLPAPPAPAAPAAPPEETALPAPPAPAAPAAPAVPPAHVHMRIMKWETPDGVQVMKWEGSGAEVDKALAQAREAAASARALRETAIRKAMAEARAARTKALAESRADVEKAMAQARIAEAEAKKQERAQIDQALAEAHAVIAEAHRQAAEARRQAEDAHRQAEEAAHNHPAEPEREPMNP